jgi:hypothetical protein
MATTFAVPDGRVAMAATLWSGTSATNNISNAVNSVSFQPDFVWLKDRTQAQYHTLYDSVRGSGSAHSLILPLTDAEGGQSNLYGYLSSFNSNGFTLTPGSTSSAWVNASGDNYVGWQWKAGGTVTAGNNTAGTITSTVSANTTAGFSVVTYTGTGANATVGHGLGVAPSMVIVKSRNLAGTDWWVWQTALAGTDYLQLDSTAAKGTAANVWNSTTPSLTVFSLGATVGNGSNSSGQTYVAYCWAPVAGYSAFGSYTGNGSADGPFIYTGFRPRFLMIKGSSLVSNWNIFDSSRATYNANDTVLFPDLSNAESSPATEPIDFLSNGIKIRNATNATNSSGNTYIYAAFAENPLRYANAR